MAIAFKHHFLQHGASESVQRQLDSIHYVYLDRKTKTAAEQKRAVKRLFFFFLFSFSDNIFTHFKGENYKINLDLLSYFQTK